MTIPEHRLMNHLLMELELSNRFFQTKLKHKFPVLTAYDIRLCTYLKANLSTKEIATLLNITPDSAKKAKHRLRKKLRIDSNLHWVQALTI